MRIISPALAATFMLASALALPPAPALAESAPARITVTGEGRADLAPDMATITLGVATEAATAAEAMAEASALVARILDRLTGEGIEARDIQTSGLGLGPRHDYPEGRGTPVLRGYQASNTVTVRVRDLARLGEVLDLAVGDGANTVHGLVFGLADPAPALDMARVRAVEDARRKAGLIAGAAGVELGPVIEMREGAGTVPPRPLAMRMAMDMAAESVPVAEGELSLAASVTITWGLDETGTE